MECLVQIVMVGGGLVVIGSICLLSIAGLLLSMGEPEEYAD